MNVNPHRIKTIKKYVDSQIILQIVDEMRLIEIVLNNVAALCRAIFNNPLTITRQVNALSLGEALRFNYIGFLFLDRLAISIEELLSEIRRLLRDEPSFRKELVLLRKGSLHFHEVSRQVILPGHDVHPRKLVDLLIRLHL